MAKQELNPADLGKLNLNVDSTEKINRIRDLIFGKQISDYDHKFERNRQELGRTSQELSRLGETMRSMESTFTQQLKSLNQTLTTQIEEQYKRHAQALLEVDQRISQQLQEMEQQHRQDVSVLENALRQSEDAMSEALRIATERLHDQKTDRVKLGDLLINIGATLKTHDSAEVVTDLLQELAEAIE